MTYAKKSLDLGLGMRDYMQIAYQDNKHAKVISSLLFLVGDKPVSTLNIDALTMILKGLKGYKLDKDAVSVAFEYLQ